MVQVSNCFRAGMSKGSLRPVGIPDLLVAVFGIIARGNLMAIIAPVPADVRDAGETRVGPLEIQVIAGVQCHPAAACIGFHDDMCAEFSVGHHLADTHLVIKGFSGRVRALPE